MKDHFIYGVQFYRPPNPPVNQRRRDLENIKKLGFNTIKVWAIWNWINYDEGKYDLSELKEIIEYSEKLELQVIINTILETCPYWVSDKYPDSHYTSAKNTRMELMERTNVPTGGWPGICFDNSKVKDEAELFLKELVRNLDIYKNVKFWDCWNEPHMEPVNDPVDNLYCYCRHSIKRYRNWLKKRYVDIDKLNSLWFKKYRSFEDINPPRHIVMGYVDMMEWRKFIAFSMIDLMNWRIKTIQKYLQKESKIISHAASDFMSLGSSLSIYACSDYEMSKNLSIYGISTHPFCSNLTSEGFSCVVELTRSMSRNKEIWLEELHGGPTMAIPSGLARSKIPQRKNFRTWNFLALASEVRGIIYWQYRHEMIGHESPGWGLVERDGSFSERSDEASKICKFLNKHADIFNSVKNKKRDLAIFVNRDNSYFNFAAEGNERDIISSIFGINQYLQKNNISSDYLIEEELERFDKYKAIVLLYPLVMNHTISKKLVDYVSNGGTLISDCLVGLFNKYGMSNEIVPAYGLDDLFGAKHLEFRRFDELNREGYIDNWATKFLRPEIGRKPDVFLNGYGNYKNHKVKVSKFLETYKIKSGEVFLRYKDECCGVKNFFGKGKTFLFGTNLCSSFLLEDKNTSKLMDNIMDEIGIIRNYSNNLMIRELENKNHKVILVSNPKNKKIEGMIDITHKYKIYDVYMSETLKKIKKTKIILSLDAGDSNCIILEKFK